MARVFARISLKYKLFLIFVLTVTVIGSLILVLYPMPDRKDIPQNGADEKFVDDKHPVTVTSKLSNHKLAIIVPFRDRFEELLDFVPHMTEFLNNQSVRHRIYAINQVDNFRFNRASLINIGYLESRSECDYIAMHDVDLLPLNSDLSYGYPVDGAFHVASPELHPLYHYKKFVGGILLLKGSDFEKLNGLSNKYWGWGLEDDEFYVRMKKQGIKISRPQGIKSGNKTFKHVHDKRKHTRDKDRFFDQKEKTRRLDKETGFSSVNYKVDSRHDIKIDGGYATIINVKLKCNLDATPWCLPKDDHYIYTKLKEQQKSKVINK